MRAITYHEFGDTSQLQLEAIPKPEPAEGEILVKIKASGINPVDYKLLRGGGKGRYEFTFPVIPGWECSGVVETRGHAARRFDLEDEVMAYTRRPVIGAGTYAEYIALPESYFTHAPATVSFEESAGLPLAGLTAYQGLIEKGHLREGKTVLILGASGGVGHFAVQIAKDTGAEVIGVAGIQNQDFIKDLGADMTIDYNNGDVAEQVSGHYSKGVDLIFDCVGGEALKQAQYAIRKGGYIVSVAGNADEDLLNERNAGFQKFLVEPDSRQLEWLAGLVNTNNLKTYVSQVYNLSEAAEAMDQIATGHTKGKHVIAMGG